MRNMPVIVIVGFALLSLGGWICLFVGLGKRRRRQALEEARRGHATGQVVALAGRAKATVAFTAEGRLYSLEAGAEGLAVGDSVEVRYDPDDPARFHIERDDTPGLDGRGLVRAGVAWIAVAAVLAAGITALPRRQQFILEHALRDIAPSGLFEKETGVPVNADTSGDYQYSTQDNGMATIERYKGDATELTVPIIVDGRAVTGLSMGAFKQSAALEKVVVPASFRSIPVAAFTGCLSLKEVEIGEGVESIGSLAFSMCPLLQRVTLPASLTAIADDAFPDDCGAVFCVPSDSFAEAYCAKKGFKVDTAG